MGLYEKIIMEFEKPFWPEDMPFIGCCPVISPRARVPVATPAAKTATKATPSCTPTVISSHPASALPPAPAVNLDPKSAVPRCPNGKNRPARAPVATTQVVAHDTPTEGRGAFDGSISAAACHCGRCGAIGHDSSNGVIDIKPSLRATPLVAAVDAARDECLDTGSGTAPASDPIAPVFLENYWWSKGVPVLAAALCGQRAQKVSEASALETESGAGTQARNGESGEHGRNSYARDLYRRLILPALSEAFGQEAEIPEPISVMVTG